MGDQWSVVLNLTVQGDKAIPVLLHAEIGHDPDDKPVGLWMLARRPAGGANGDS